MTTLIDKVADAIDKACGLENMPYGYERDCAYAAVEVMLREMRTWVSINEPHRGHDATICIEAYARENNIDLEGK